MGIIASTSLALKNKLADFSPREIRYADGVQVLIVQMKEVERERIYKLLSSESRGHVAVLDLPYIPSASENSVYSRDSYEGFLEILNREVQLVREGLSDWVPPTPNEIFTAKDLFATIHLMAFNGCSDLQVMAGREVMARNEKAEMEPVQRDRIMPEAEILEFLREVTRLTNHFSTIESMYTVKNGVRFPNFDKVLPPDLNFVYSVISEDGTELVSRLRINVHLVLTQEVNARGLALSIRKVPAAAPSPKKLGFNSVAERLVNDICQQLLHRGLVLFVGPTGSGKTLSMAAVVNQLNERQPVNIITIEDPVEIIHTAKRASIQQIEIGTCITSFEEAGRNALRQDPDVVVIGEIRDADTAKVAVELALTGHLVLVTMHAATTSFEAIEKLVEMVGNREVVVKALKAIVAQRLLSIKRPPQIFGSDVVGSKRLLAMEVCRLTDRNKLKDKVLKGEMSKKNFSDLINFTATGGFCTTLEDALIEFVLDEKVTASEALEFTDNKHEFLSLVNGLVRAAREYIEKTAISEQKEDEVKFHQTVLRNMEEMSKNYYRSVGTVEKTG